jgi:hypothetical protein
MTSKSFIRLGVCATVFAAASASAFPVSIHSNIQAQTTAPLNKSASGKVSTVANDGFSLDVKAGENPSTLQFVTDGKTKVTGTLAVGATVSVEYRTDGEGRNVAVAVVVQSNG